MSGRVRAAVVADAAAVARIYNEGIADRIATVETTPRAPADMEARIASGEPMLVAERDDAVVGWASWSPYSDRCGYAGVGEYTIYVARAARGQGVGARLLGALVDEARRRGLHKLVGRIFTTNAPSIALAREQGFREVGVHVRHGVLDGAFKDVLIVERLLDDGGPPPP